MSNHGNELGLITTWVKMRADVLNSEWVDEFHVMIGGFSFPALLRIRDVATRQARAECLAYMCGEPIPNSREALSELLAWLRENHCCSGDSEGAADQSR